MLTVKDQENLIELGRANYDSVVATINSTYRINVNYGNVTPELSEILLEDIADWKELLKAPTLELSIKAYWLMDTASRETLMEILKFYLTEKEA